jgi:hypothetical protein
MPFVPNASAAEFKTPKKGRFVPNEEKTFGGAAENLWEDTKTNVKGLGTLAEGLVEHPIDTTVSVAKNLPGAIIDEGKRLGVGELITGHPIKAGEKFVDAAYDKPLTTAMSVFPAAGAIGKGVGAGMKAMRGAGAAEAALDAATVAAKTAVKEAPATLGVDDLISVPKGAVPKSATMEAAEEFAKNPPKSPPAPVPPVDPLAEVKNFVTQKYGKAAETPGLVQNLGTTLENKARGMRLKEIGSTPGQVRTLRDRFGETAVNELADLAETKGVTKGFFNWQTGKEIKRLNETSGRQIGAIRDIAKTRGAVHEPNQLIQAIRAELDPVYLKGTGSSQKGVYMKALEDIKNSPQDVVSLADTISEKNRFVKKNKMTQPLGATTDVLNKASKFNNDLIRKHLNPKELALYEESLKDFSAAKVFDKMYGFTYGRDMAGRSGPASPINFVKDVGGRKIMEKVYSKMGKSMQKSPGDYGNPMKLSADVLDAIDEALDEVIDQMGTAPHTKMAHGGIAGIDNDALYQFLDAQYGNPKEKQ